MRVPFEHVHRFVASNGSYLDIAEVGEFEQSAGCFVPKVVESQICDFGLSTSFRKSMADGTAHFNVEHRPNPLWLRR